MYSGTKRLKQDARRRQIPLRRYARRAAANPKHPHHDAALRWLRVKGTSLKAKRMAS